MKNKLSRLRMDPTRTGGVRRRFLSDLNRRLAKLAADIRKLIVEEDAFGLVPRTRVVSLAQQFAFATDANKLRAFHQWLQTQVDAGFLTVSGKGKPGQPWTYEYVDSAYRQGMLRAYTDTHKAALATIPAWYVGSREQFMRTAFMQPIAMDDLELLSTRTYEQLKGITSAMSQQLSRTLSTALVSGWGAEKTAREIRKTISGISRTRARMLARTELIHAHAEGQLDSFSLLGVQKLDILAEWSTAGDDLVCKRCYKKEGRVYTIDEARGMIPLHPDCRCSWLPAE
jgi:SPP1 gp7 family putative phage head morphogenesis protein